MSIARFVKLHLNLFPNKSLNGALHLILDFAQIRFYEHFFMNVDTSTFISAQFRP